MEPDFDDTVRAAPRPAVAPTERDIDDTVARRAVPASVVRAPVAPPALVEPLAPERRPLSLVVDSAVEDAADPPAAATARKQVFHVLFTDGTEVALDVTMYVGRKPSVPRIHTGAAPQLVTLPSPAKELSATHLELKVVGGSVVATDMRSTNGTIVQLPGAAPRILIRGESAVLVPGTRIDLGEGAVLDILAPHAGDPS